MARKQMFSRCGFGAVLSGLGAAALLILSAHTARANSSARGQAGQSSTQSTAKPNLAGTWKLNKDQSDDPRQKMQEAMGGAMGGERRGGGGGNREPGTGRPGRGGGGMMAEWNQLTIDQTDASVKVTGASGRLLATSESQTKSDTNSDNGGMRFPPASVEWQGSQLVAKSHGFGGGTTTRTFELSSDGKQLTVTTKMESERMSQPVTFKLVYDPGKAESNSQ